MIYVLGDSHSRSFAKNANFLPLFIGPGKENCFISNKTKENVKHNIGTVLTKIPDNSKVLIVLGEPDTRYYLGKSWTPWLIEGEENISDVECKIESSFIRYQEVIQWMKEKFNHDFIIFNVIPSVRKNQNIYVKAFNNLLRHKLVTLDVMFLDIENKLISDHGVVDKEYIADEVHLNNTVQLHVEEFLIQRGLIEHSQYKKTDADYDSKTVQKNFVFDKRFSCYVYDQKSKITFVGLFKKISEYFAKLRAQYAKF